MSAPIETNGCSTGHPHRTSGAVLPDLFALLDCQIQREVVDLAIHNKHLMVHVLFERLLNPVS
jgi:hypothetical protein